MTGASGLIGSWLVAALVRRGVGVVVLRRPGGTSPRAGRVTTVEGELTDEPALAAALADHEVDTVFHLAAQSIVGSAREAPTATFETNVRGTWTVLEACRRHGTPRVVVAGSDKAYGPGHQPPYREGQALAPAFPYDVSKACADLLARSYWHAYALPVAVTRLTNVYGGADRQTSRLIPAAVGAALAGRPPIIRSDGTPRRDFLYVEDAVEAYLHIAQALGDPHAGVRGQALNGGSEQPCSVRAVVELVCALTGTGQEPDIQGSGTPPGELEDQWVDASRLRELTGWRARVGLEEGLRRTVEWYRAHPDALC
ncbi:MAG TPA: NAD-dependent epimerase/dehydratase family protein [Solirubrobacteraceae bacterium]|nr:NAD-dependent epimerase/dehydratase family protein [Solirubrobacteraceae bacterium]